MRPRCGRSTAARCSPAGPRGARGCSMAWARSGRRCRVAGLLTERGVRFVQVFLNSQPWDTHAQNAARLRDLCAMTDQPSAALVLDLKRRGLLDSTIVLWTGEFGRLPVSQGTD